MFHRCDPTNNFISSSVEKTEVILQAGQLIGVFNQRMHSASNRRCSRVVTRCRRNDVIRNRLNQCEFFAVDSRVSDNRCHVIGWVGTTIFSEFGEVSKEILNNCDQVNRL